MTNDPLRKKPADGAAGAAADGAAGGRPQGAADRPGEPEIVEGEIVDDAAAGPYRDRPADDAGLSGRSPFDDQPPFAGSSPFGGPGAGAPGMAGLFGTGGPGALGALRMVAGNSPELRSLVTAPLRMLAVGAGVPALIALVFGLTIDGGPRFVAFGIALLGALAAVLVELRRRRLVAVPPPHRAGDPAAPKGSGHLIRLIGFALLMMMLGIGFDLLALVLVIFGAW